MAQISRCSNQIHKEIGDICTETSNLVEQTMPANYYFYGEDALQELEDARLEDLEKLED